jgi:hypothetical protein
MLQEAIAFGGTEGVFVEFDGLSLARALHCNGGIFLNIGVYFME